MKQYNKLVRDRIPELIRSGGEIPQTRVLAPEEYALRLEQKLDEEVEEFHRDRNPEELADILEVVFALASTLGCSEEALLTLRRQKKECRGGFQDRVFLISKE
ncbi:MAG: nucleoside triphosphate pyrophosphohydrolase [Oscillospiraceae bacterium]|nr:nucleoside triphosphate pyrophosphohydrolase [Oscillospiraceae bacterium]